MRRGITWEGLGSNSKTNAERGADKDMANYVERLTKALMETGDFSEKEARAFVEELVRELMGRGVEGEDGGDTGGTRGFFAQGGDCGWGLELNNERKVE